MHVFTVVDVYCLTGFSKFYACIAVFLSLVYLSSCDVQLT